MIPTMGLSAAADAIEAAKAKKKGGRGRELTDEEKAALGAAVGGMMGGVSPYGSTLFGSKIAESLKERRNKRYGSGAREIRGGNPYGYSS